MRSTRRVLRGEEPSLSNGSAAIMDGREAEDDASSARASTDDEEEEPVTLVTLPPDIVLTIAQHFCDPTPTDLGACHLAGCCRALQKVLRPTLIDHLKQLRRVHKWCKTKNAKRIDLLADNSSREICAWQNLRNPDGAAMASIISWGLCSKTWNFLMGNTNLYAECAKLAPAFTVQNAMPALHSLSLNNCGIGDAGVVALTDAWSAGALRHLYMLDFAENPFGDVGSLALVECFRSGGLDGINDLHLTNPCLTDVFGDAMAAALNDGALPKLRRIQMRYFRGGKGSAETCARLASACRERNIMLIDGM